MGSNTREIARDVARALGAGWSIDRKYEMDGNNGAMLDHTDGRRLHIFRQYSTPAGKVSISGVYPYRSDMPTSNTEHVSINVSRDKAPTAIARDIERRLMPTYERELAKLRETYEQRDKNNAQREAMVRRVYRIMGKPDTRDARAREQDSKNSQTRISLSGITDGYGDMTIYHDGTSAAIELHSIPADLALDILATAVNYGKN